ncbi:CHASE domain-containing protein [Pseudidiomarina sp.]|uniref:CHASE domain-containing protein n=1 Tax=Pseudidiomarina sp. TaxID=2081707 RepID=UPI003A97A796
MKKRMFRSLEWYHWFVVFLSLALTLTAWHVTRTQAHEKAEALFKFQAGQVIELLQERMAKYEEALKAGVAMLQVLPAEMERKDWRIFAESLNIEARFPGINGIGVIHYVPALKKTEFLAWQRAGLASFDIFPTHQEANFWPISYIEPLESNFKAVGLDMAHEANRFNAAKRARDERTAHVTGPIILVQDDKQTPGFLFFVPWFSKKIPNTYGDAKTEFAGLVYAPFIVNKLMGGALSNVSDLINFKIYDGQTLLFEDQKHSDASFEPMFTEARNVEIYGRTWRFDLETSAAFAQQVETLQPTIILATGILIDILLITLFILLSNTKTRATEIAYKATEGLTKRQQELELIKDALTKQNQELLEANKELDRFAFVASHDLKAPLRGIAQLTEWIEDETHGKLSVDAQHYLALLKSRVLRLEKLLNALLQYSRVDKKAKPEELVNFKAFLQELFSLNAHPEGFELRIDAKNVEQIWTDREALERVVGNIVNNSVKHHNRGNGVIRVTSVMSDNCVEISIADDGPGIADEHRDKVFELFHTLKPRDEVEGSGLGLAIVKKILEKKGGDYRLESNEWGGLTFVVRWPVKVRDHKENQKNGANYERSDHR